VAETGKGWKGGLGEVMCGGGRGWGGEGGGCSEKSSKGRGGGGGEGRAGWNEGERRNVV